ncbi:MAG: hypothetical protein ABIB71_04005 [Candidatus Woesearchaeota archaeon]
MARTNKGEIEEENLINTVEESLPKKYGILSPPAQATNLFYFKLIGKANGLFEALFEIYSPLYDDALLFERLKLKGSATLLHDYLISGILKKYFKQFKGNPPKFLIINLNNKGGLKGVNLNYVPSSRLSDIAKLFSTKSYPNGCSGLFHIDKLELKPAGGTTNSLAVNINHLAEVMGVITFFNGRFKELIINPHNRKANEACSTLKQIFGIEFVTQNNPVLNAECGAIVLPQQEYMSLVKQIRKYRKKKA